MNIKKGLAISVGSMIQFHILFSLLYLEKNHWSLIPFILLDKQKWLFSQFSVIYMNIIKSSYA